MNIDLINIGKSFGAFAAMKDVTLTIPSGQLVALLGPSGSGKTTLLRIIAGLEFPEAGEVLFGGKPATWLKARERRVGFVFQHYALFRHMTVFDNIAFGLRVRPRKQRPSRAEIERRVARLLELVQLDSMASRLPSQLSGGQRQRVALARALAVEPQVLLLDEPFGSLDAKVRLDLRRWLRQLHDEIHITSVFVTHDQEEALEVADTVVVMNGGRIAQAGTPQEIYEHPSSAFVCDFLGNLNIFEARIEGRTAHIGSGTMDLPRPLSESAERALVYVRPHQMEISLLPDGRNQLRARVAHINAAGPLAKVELVAAEGRSIRVEMSHERLHLLGLSRGLDVFLAAREVRVFTGLGVEIKPQDTEQPASLRAFAVGSRRRE